MIIIKIIILYFIQIRHTDDFPPTVTPASVNNVVSLAQHHFSNHYIGYLSISAHLGVIQVLRNSCGEWFTTQG